SCSPHIAPEGPPPTIAISAMILSRCWYRTPSLNAERTGGGRVWQYNFSRRSPSSGGKNHQAKPDEKYSTEKGRRRRRGGYFPDNFHAPNLERTKERKVGRKENQQDLGAVQEQDTRDDRAPCHYTKQQCIEQSSRSHAGRCWTEQQFFRSVIGKHCEKKWSEALPSRQRQPGLAERQVNPGRDEDVQKQRRESSGEQREVHGPGCLGVVGTASKQSPQGSPAQHE